MSTRRAVEGQLEIGTSEKRAIAFDFTNWSLGTLSAPAVTVFDVTTTRTDVTSTVMPTNSPALVSQTVTTSVFRGDLATVDHHYRVECAVSHGSGEVSELWVDVVVRY